MKHHKPWFDKKCSKFLDQREQTKIQWVQDPNQSNVDNVNLVRFEAIRYFRRKLRISES